MGKIEKKVPKKIQNYFSSVISGIKSQTPSFHVSTAIKLFHGRKRPKSLPFFPLHLSRRHSHQNPVPEAVPDSGPNSASATLDDIDRYLFENFRSLYGDNENEDREVEEEVAELDDARNSFEIPVPALIDLRGSSRFFITPVSSGSLIEEARTNSEVSGFESFNVAALKIDILKNSVEIPNGGFAMERSRTLDNCVAVVTVSASPYEDFLQSMADVMKAGAKRGRGIDWEFMEELLFSYLRLNEKEYYRYVLRAFVDLVVDLRQS